VKIERTAQEPLVLTMPAIESGRYYSAQFIDLYTFNFAYAGSRATGNGGGNFLLAGPGWKGETPANIKQVIRCETSLAGIVIRTQLFNPNDIDKVKAIQEGYKVHRLSQFTGQPAPTAAPNIDFIKPLTADEERSSLDFFNVLNFCLQFCPTDSSETALMARFAKINVGAGKTFDAATLTPENTPSAKRSRRERSMALGWYRSPGAIESALRSTASSTDWSP